MSNSYRIETSRKVLDCTGACIEVRPDGDGLECVEVLTPDPKSVDYFGAIRFVLEPKAARMLGLAIIKTAEELGATKD